MNSVPVVVGVDETPDARTAVLWAAHEASLAHTSLLIVHSPDQPAAATPAGLLSSALRACDDLGRSVLDSSAALACAAQPEIAVNVLLSHAEPAQALIDVSTQAQLVVLGSRRTATGEMSLMTSKRLLVSAHAHCPVMLLGPVSTFSSSQGVSRVAVGVADTLAGRAALAYASAEAVRRNVPLELVRLDREPAMVAAATSQQRQDSARYPNSALDNQASRISRQFPSLSVVTTSAFGDPVEMLPHYSGGSTILVLGCHHTDDHWSTRLGPVATSVAHRNRGAVVVVGYDAW
jgi:nucleotide-binding universal stress UspA family protein